MEFKVFKKLPGSVQYTWAKMIYRRHETILILISLERYFSYPKNQYLIKGDGNLESECILNAISY